MPFISKFFSGIENVVVPPFKGAGIFLWLAFVFLYLTGPHNPLWQGNLSDPDDYLYLVQALDGLKGQSWFDLLQHRMNPPEGTFIHYSHILSGFYSCFIFAFRGLFDETRAALLTAAILPLVYFALLLFVLDRIAQVLVDKDWGGPTAYVVFFSGCVSSQYLPGHLDHHGLQLLLSLCAFACLMQMMLDPQKLIWPVAAGLCLALSLAIALEVILVLSLLSLGIGIWALIEAKNAARDGFVFGGALFATSFALLLLTHAWDQVFVPTSQAFSIVYVALTGLFALCLASTWAVSKFPSVYLRFGLCGVVASLCGSFFLLQFPLMSAGPYGETNPEVAKVIFTLAPEAWPLFRAGAGWNKIFFPLACPLLAIWASLLMAWQTRQQARRGPWFLTALILLVCTPFAAFYQMRFLSYLDAFCALPLAALAFDDWKNIPGASAKERVLRIIRFALVMIMVPLSAIGVGKFEDDLSPSSVPRGPIRTEKNCNIQAFELALNDKSGYGSHPRLFINSINEGTEILFRTKHTVLAAPYHMNTGGNLDAVRFFKTIDPQEARAIALGRGAGFVLLCPTQLEMRAYESNIPGVTSFAQQLVAGQIPSWLKALQSPTPNDLLLFEVIFD